MNKYILAAISAAVIWAFVVIAFRQVQSYNSEHILLLRIVITFILAWFISAIAYRKHITTSIKTIKGLSKYEKIRTFIYAVVCGAMLTGNWYTFIYITNHISVHSASLVYCIAPIVTVLLGFMVLKERLDIYKKVAFVLAIVGVSILMINNWNSVAWVIACASCYSVFIILHKKNNKFHVMIAYTFYVSVCLVLVSLFRFEVLVMMFKAIDLYFVFILIIIAVLFTLLPMIINLYALSHLDASTSGIISYFNPLFTFLISKIIYHEVLNIRESIAYILILITVVVFNWKGILVVVGKGNSIKGRVV